jgi:hypothetical protein
LISSRREWKRLNSHSTKANKRLPNTATSFVLVKKGYIPLFCLLFVTPMLFLFVILTSECTIMLRQGEIYVRE